MEQNIFELATRQKLRFATSKGEADVEALWDMPLVGSRAGFDLDSVFKTVNAELKAEAEESLVATSVNARRAKLELQLAVIRHIAGVKQSERDAAAAAAARSAERAKLTDLLAKKQDAALGELTAEEIKARLAELKP